MNRILKVVFSRVKGMFVVVSELGHASSKSAVKSVLVTVPLVLASTGVMAADDPSDYFSINTSTTPGTKIDGVTYAQAVGSGSLAIGISAVALGTSSYAFGQQALAGGIDSFALGNSAQATGASSIAVGSAQAGADLSFAMGVGAQTTSTALRAIALGYQSVADSADTVSVGNSTLKRKIVNVAKGNISENSTDAVTGHQLWETKQLVNSNTTQINTLNTTVSNHTDAIGNLTTKVSSYESTIGSYATEIDALKNVQVDWTKLSGSNTNPYTDVETQAQNAIQAQARSAISLSTAANKPISVTETSAGSGQWLIDLAMDSVVTENSKNLVSSGTVYGEVRPADGTYVKNNQTTATNLSALDSQVETNADNISTLNTSKANTDLGNLSTDGKNQIKTLAQGAIVINEGTHVDVEGSNGNYTVNVVSKDTVTNESVLVTGKAVTAALTPINNSIVDWTKLSGSNTNAYTDVETQAQNAIQVQARSAISIDKSSGSDSPLTIHKSTDGLWLIDLEMDDQVNDGSNKLVSSDQVFDAIAQAKSITDNNLLIKATTQGATPSSDFHYLNNEWTTGQNLYALDQALYSVAMKPSSSTISVGNWRSILKASSSTPVDSSEDGLITGSQLYHEVRPADGKYISQTKTTAENLFLLDTKVKENADAIISLGGRVSANETDIGELKGKVSTNESNIAALDGRVSTVEDKITTNTTAISNLQSNVSDNQASITNLSGRVTTVETNVTTNTADIAALDGRVTTTESGISALDGRVSANESGISEMKGKVSANASLIAVNTEAIETNKNAIAANKAATEANAGKIAANEGKIAENASAIQANTEMIGQNASNIQTLSNQVNKTYDKVQRVGAGAAALAALRPQDFSPEHPISGAVGLGHYDGKQAIAVGMYYRPTENFTVGFGASAAGNDDYMMNAGISYRFGGSGSQLRISQSDINRKVVDLTDQNRALVAQIESSNIREEASAKRLRAAEKKAELSEQKLDMVMKELAVLREEVQKLKQK